MLLFCFTTTSVLANTAKILGWTRAPELCTLCGGYYKDNVNILENKTPAPIKDTPLDIKSSKSASLKNHGESVISGDVVLTQPGREIKADHVTFFRDKNTNKVTNSLLSGNVKFYEYGRLVVADKSYLDFTKEEYTLDNGIYRLLSDAKPNGNNGWGTIKHGVREPDGILKMRKATYSTCPPDATSWYLWSNSLTLNRSTGVGQSFNTVLFFEGIPVFYTPYFNFPIDKRRKTGFLAPSFNFSANPGYSLSLPLYLNLAPNYDATFTPSFYNARGVLLAGEFNYKTAKTLSKIDINYINQDKQFIKFREDYSSRQLGPVPTHAQTVLKNSSVNRALFNINNNTNYNANWKSSLLTSYTTDDYFLQDFGSTATSINQDQLFNQAQIQYTDTNWAFSGRAEGFQTLHRIDKDSKDGSSIAKDLYRKLPQVNLSGFLPSGFGGLDYYMATEAVNFVKRDDFDTLKPSLGGGRFNLESGASLPLAWMGGSLTPKLSVQATQYALHDRISHARIEDNEPKNITRALPMLSVDGRLFFNRNTSFLSQTYTQTLEPRLFYLWVPNKNQDDIPIFDTTLPGFDFNQLFRTNRFSGIDRTGDANQASFALTSRILNDAGQEKVNMGIGQMLTLHKHQVVLTPSHRTDLNPPDPLLNEYLSPIAGKIQYLLTPKFDVKTEGSWDPNYNHFNTASVNLQYKEASDKVVNFWYNYNLDGDPLEGKKHDLSRIGCSAGWRLWQHWNILSGIDYNVSYKRPQRYTYGLEYESCCFAVRLLCDKTYVGSNIKYKSGVYVQILLKGLGDSKGLEFGGLSGSDSNVSGGITGYDNQHIMGI